MSTPTLKLFRVLSFQMNRFTIFSQNKKKSWSRSDPGSVLGFLGTKRGIRFREEEERFESESQPDWSIETIEYNLCRTVGRAYAERLTSHGIIDRTIICFSL